jgi:hypothetical protein
VQFIHLINFKFQFLKTGSCNNNGVLEAHRTKQFDCLNILTAVLAPPLLIATQTLEVVEGPTAQHQETSFLLTNLADLLIVKYTFPPLPYSFPVFHCLTIAPLPQTCKEGDSQHQYTHSAQQHDHQFLILGREPL